MQRGDSSASSAKAGMQSSASWQGSESPSSRDGLVGERTMDSLAQASTSDSVSAAPSAAARYAKLWEVERSPDVPDDLERVALSRGGSQARTYESGSKNNSRCWSTSVCFCGALIVMCGFAVALLPRQSTKRSNAASSISLPHQVPGGVRSVLQPSQESRADRRNSALSSEKSASVKVTSSSAVPWGIAAGKLAQEFCNLTAPWPKVTLRTWDIPDSWKRVCEMKNVKDMYPMGRNWCWVGFNNMCHWNLKSHKSWEEFQDMAARDGIAPPRSEQSFHPIDDHELCDVPDNGRVREWSTLEQAMAREWFKNHVAVYVLSLPTQGDERWNMIKGRLDDLRIWATRVPGVDMRAAGAFLAAKQAGFIPPSFNFSKAQDTAYSWKHNMGSILGTAGCAAAHFKAHVKAIADGAPLAIIMEDDSWPSDDFVPRLWHMVRTELPCDWEVTALLSRCGYGKCVSPQLMRVMPDANEPEWRCRQGSNWGMHAVLYRTEALPRLQEKWKATVFDPDRPHCMDVDVALASMSEHVGFYAVPAVQNPGFVSETDHRSARWDINQAAASTTLATTTTHYEVPTMKPGEPWPGAWSYG